jgi:hypothetical protein
MKKLIVIAIALGFSSISAFAQFGSYNAGIYEAEESAAETRAANMKLIQADLKDDGKADSDLAKAYIASLAPQADGNTADQTDRYETDYDNTVALYKHKYAIDNEKIYAPYLKRVAKADGQIMIANAQAAVRQNALANQAAYEGAYSDYLKSKCRNMNTLSPNDMMLCSKQFLQDDDYARGKRRYYREKELAKMFE